MVSTQGCNCPAGICLNCGGRWNVTVSPPSSSQVLPQNIISTHQIASGECCITCGIEQGVNILTNSSRWGIVPARIII